MVSIPSHIPINSNIIRLSVLFSLLFCFTCGQVLPNSLLINGGFEIGVLFDDPAFGWFIPIVPEGPYRNIHIDDTVAHTGSNSLRFASYRDYYSELQTVNVLTGFTYELTFWVRTPQPDLPFLAFAQFAGYDEQQVVQTDIYSIARNEWTKYSANITAPQQTATTIPLTIRFSVATISEPW